MKYIDTFDFGFDKDKKTKKRARTKPKRNNASLVNKDRLVEEAKKLEKEICFK